MSLATKYKEIVRSLNKRGQAGISSKLNYLIGAVVLISIVVALAPQMFNDLANTTFTNAAPAWVSSALPIMVGAGLVFLVWRAFGTK